MTFATSAYLRRATSRAKSDVANKLVGMLLHSISRKINATLGMSVTDAVYADAVADAFGGCCCYCGQVLEEDRAAVEHLQGMNRFRLGLHIPGNVIVACKRCNGEKRRDDQMPKLKLAETGWESFLNHDSTRCDLGCKTCSRWAALWPDLHERIENLGKTREKIKTFRARYPEALEWSSRIQDSLPHTVEALYRDCQRFAEEQIDKIVDDVLPKVRKQAAAGTQDLG